jgi:hypothetical protein
VRACVRTLRFVLVWSGWGGSLRCIRRTRSGKTQNPSQPPFRPRAPMAMESAASSPRAALPAPGASRKRRRSQSPPPAGEGRSEPALARPRFGENLDLILSLQGKELSLQRSHPLAAPTCNLTQLCSSNVALRLRLNQLFLQVWLRLCGFCFVYCFK